MIPLHSTPRSASSRRPCCAFARAASLVPAIALVAATVPAQRVVHDFTTPLSRLGEIVRAVGDVDGDGVQDFAATRIDSGGTDELWVLSGSSGSRIHRLTGIDPQNRNNALDATGLGDTDNDGRSDFALWNFDEVRVHSGASGTLRYTVQRAGNNTIAALCAVGDHDGDGRADFALGTQDGNGNVVIGIRSGANGSTLLTSTVSLPAGNDATVLLPAGDLDQDGRQDLAFATRTGVLLLTASPLASRHSIQPFPTTDRGRVHGAADLDGDGRAEILIGRPELPLASGAVGRIDVHDGDTGLLRFSIQIPYAGQNSPSFGRVPAVGIGDLDQDGTIDLATGIGTNLGQVLVVSGSTGRRLWTFTDALPRTGLGNSIAALGDVDGDGFGDVVAGAWGQAQGGWAVLSGRILADVVDVGGACGEGPFFPQLGMSRPVLGANVTIACRDGTPGAPSTLALSLQPPYPIALGASTCRAAFDTGAWQILHAAGGPPWSIQVPLPNVPQLAGLPLALQVFQVPTGGALGFDLSNGLWARLGGQ